MSLLSVAQLRSLVNTSASDAALALALAAAEAQVARVAGPLGEITEVHPGGGSVVILARSAPHLRVVTEGDDEPLAASDFRLEPDGRSVTRLDDDGVTPRRWGSPTAFTFTPRDDVALQSLVVAELVKGILNSNPGVLGMTEGNFSIQFANGTSWNATSSDALAQLGPEWGFA